jgi:hypothetical protein
MTDEAWVCLLRQIERQPVGEQGQRGEPQPHPQRPPLMPMAARTPRRPAATRLIARARPAAELWVPAAALPT